MILNTFPLSDDQPVPNFVINFYSDLRQFLLNADTNYESVSDAVNDLLSKRGVFASVSLNTITVNDWDIDNYGEYIIMCWQNQKQQFLFIDCYDNFEAMPAQQPFSSYHH